MIRRYKFDGGDPFSRERFEVLYDGLCGSPRGFKAPTETRVVGAILGKLETIGRPTSRDGLATYELKGGKQELTLEETEFQLAIDALQQVSWTARAARKATAVLEWFQAAKSEDDAGKTGAAK